jgi:uridine kinase
MAETSLRYLVGISGPHGAGKTALVQGLSAAMHDTTAIYMDSYRQMAPPVPEQVQRWLRQESGVGEFQVRQLPEHLATLRSGAAVTEPGTGAEIPPRKYVLFETRYGRAHRATGRDIDLLVYLDTPLDVALARNLRTGLAASLRDTRKQLLEDRVRGIQKYLDQYLDTVRALTILEKRRVAADADLIVDGLLPIPQLIEQVKQEILRRLP